VNDRPAAGKCHPVRRFLPVLYQRQTPVTGKTISAAPAISHQNPDIVKPAPAIAVDPVKADQDSSNVPFCFRDPHLAAAGRNHALAVGPGPDVIEPQGAVLKVPGLLPFPLYVELFLQELRNCIPFNPLLILPERPDSCRSVQLACILLLSFCILKTGTSFIQYSLLQALCWIGPAIAALHKRNPSPPVSKSWQ
jgi:hypothetical protein